MNLCNSKVYYIAFQPAKAIFSCALMLTINKILQSHDGIGLSQGDRVTGILMGNTGRSGNN